MYFFGGRVANPRTRGRAQGLPHARLTAGTSRGGAHGAEPAARGLHRRSASNLRAERDAAPPSRPVSAREPQSTQRLDWADLSQHAFCIASREVGRQGLPSQAAEDLAQQTLLRLLVANRRRSVHSPAAWLGVAIRHACLDVQRGRPYTRRLGPSAGSSSDDLLQSVAADETFDPSLRAQRREACQRAHRLIARLPMPYRAIAELQLVHQWSRREMALWLCHWRPVRGETCRTLIRKAHQMLRVLGAGTDPRHHWPGRYGKKNPWIGTPPPPFSRLSR